VDVAGVQTLTLSPLDQKQDTWGVAMLKLQANLPDTLPGQNVTFLLVGDVEIQNAVSSNVDEGEASAPAGVTLEVTVSTMSPLIDSLTNPSTTNLPKMLNAGTKVTADGYLELAQMIHVQLEDGTQGWLLEQMVTVDGDVKTLPAFDMDGKPVASEETEAPPTAPMQAFYFKSGANDAPCDEAPDSGILIQTPEGAGKIELTINDVKVELGSTGYFQAQPGADMTVSVVEGEGTLEADGVTVTVPAGSISTVPVDNNLQASGPPTPPQPYNPDNLRSLPIKILPRTITIAPAFVEATLEPGANPVPGQWTIVNGEPVLGAGCPEGMAQIFANAGIGGRTNTVIIPEGPFSLQAVFAANPSAQLPAGVEYGNPESGVYTMSVSQEGATTVYEFRVISSTEIQTTISVEAEGCSMTFPGTMTPAGG
jgi:hypothetical protein